MDFHCDPLLSVMLLRWLHVFFFFLSASAEALLSSLVLKQPLIMEPHFPHLKSFILWLPSIFFLCYIVGTWTDFRAYLIQIAFLFPLSDDKSDLQKSRTKTQELDIILFH